MYHDSRVDSGPEFKGGYLDFSHLTELKIYMSLKFILLCTYSVLPSSVHVCIYF